MSAHNWARTATAPDLSRADSTATGDSLITAALPLPAPRPASEGFGVSETVFAETVSAALVAGARGYLFDGPRTRPYLVAMRDDQPNGHGAPFQNALCVTERPPLFTVLDVKGSPCTLTSHEVEILQHVADGETSKIIGHRLDLSPGSIKSHLRRAGGRLGTTDRARMVLLAMRAGAVL